METSDILIIGGGAAGCVLAARLSQFPSLKVTLIEAGRDILPDSTPDDIKDIFPTSYANPAYFWPALKARIKEGEIPRPYMQARVFGGGGNVMGMWALRGVPDDYETWAALGAKGWSYADVLPYFKKLENDLDFAGAPHGRDGPILIKRTMKADWPLYNKVLADAAERTQLPYREDLNASAEDGVFPAPISTDGVRRYASANGYLTSEVRKRANLKVITGAEVERLVFEGKKVIGIEARRGEGERLTLKAQTVVVTAGALHTPALLLRSGIGPASELKALGIEVVHDLPGVGENLQNHCFVHLGAFIKREARQHTSMRNFTMTCVRFSSRETGAPASDLLISFAARTSGQPAGNRIGLVSAHLYSPFSKGKVSLSRVDGRLAPAVDFRMLSDARDKSRMIRSAEFGRRLLDEKDVREVTNDPFILPAQTPIRTLNGPGMKSVALGAAMAILAALPSPLRRAALDANLGKGRFLAGMEPSRFAELVLASTIPMFHPAGTCALGSVLEPDTRVKGIEGLYVADASAMPTVPRANTNIPTLMVAEKSAAAIAGMLGG